MKSLFSIFSLTLLGVIFFSSEASAAQTYQRYRQPTYVVNPNYQYQGTTAATLTCSSYTSASVGVSTLSNGVVVTIDSPDYILQNCIKNTAWISYFTRFGNTVNLSVSNTTRGVQITATSYDTDTVSNLQNARWTNLITGTTTYNNTNGYVYNQAPLYYTNNQVYYTPPTNYYNPAPVYGQTYYTPPTYYVPPTNTYNPNYPQNTYNPSYPQNPYYVVPARVNRPGSSIFPNVNMIYRAVVYTTNGAKVTLSSADYNTMRYIQGYSFSSLFSDLSGISISTSIISGGVELTITAGSSSTIDQIQKAAYALVYQ